MPVEAVIVDSVEVPVYLRIAEEAKHLRELGMSDKAVARALGVSDKTVARSFARVGHDMAKRLTPRSVAQAPSAAQTTPRRVAPSQPMRPGSSRFAVLFGAGASFGAVDPPYRPPLGAGLFEQLVSACPATWGALSDDDKQRFEGPDRGLAFEQGMQWLWDRDQRGELAVQDLITDMAVFFADFQLPPGGNDCYSQLLSCIRRANIIGNRVAIATLNYECLLELAAAGLHIPADPSP